MTLRYTRSTIPMNPSLTLTSVLPGLLPSPFHVRVKSLPRNKGRWHGPRPRLTEVPGNAAALLFLSFTGKEDFGKAS